VFFQILIIKCQDSLRYFQFNHFEQVEWKTSGNKNDRWC
jgi:hypothetical protein